MYSVDASTGLPLDEQQPNDKREYRVDFANLLRGDAISGSPTVVAEAQGDVTGAASLSVGPITVDGQDVRVWLTGGTSGERYKVTTTVTGSIGIYEYDFMLRVLEH